MTADPVEELIAAWLAWNDSARTEWLALRKEAAIRACGIHGSQAHDLIADRRRAGWTIPDAVQATVLELAPHLSAHITLKDAA